MPFLSGKLAPHEDFETITKACQDRYGHITKAHHVWINTIEKSNFRKSLEALRTHTNIIESIRTKFPNCNVYSVHESDEIYWAVSPSEAGGSDRALVDCHYDAPFSILPTGGVTFYRIIVAMNENSTVTTVFPTEQAKTIMNTGDYHGLDYNQDWHCVEGQIPPQAFRVLLKLHYLVVPKHMEVGGFWPTLIRWVNVTWTFVSRETMRMSAEPTNVVEWVIAMIVNICRIAFNQVYLVLFLLLFVWGLSKRGRKALDLCGF